MLPGKQWSEAGKTKKYIVPNDNENLPLWLRSKNILFSQNNYSPTNIND